MVSRLIRVSAMAVLLVVAVSEGGPRSASEWSILALFGADPEPGLDPDCNGQSDSDTFQCNEGCGATNYTSKKPVAEGGVLNKRWENDVQVCKGQPPPKCPLTYSMKLVETKCTEVKQKGEN